MYTVGALFWLMLLLVAWTIVGRSLNRGIEDKDPDRRARKTRRDGRKVPVLAFTLLATALPAMSQDRRTVSLDEALELFARNNLELQLGRARAEQLTMLISQASAFPNPALQVSFEPLTNDGDTQSETYLNLNQRLEWPKSRSARRGVARALANSAWADVAVDSLRLAFEVKRTFVSAVAAEERRAVLEEVNRAFEMASQAAATQFAEGDESGYRLRRIRIERARYEQVLALAELEVRNTARELALLLFPGEEAAMIVPQTAFTDAAPALALADALATAGTSRPEFERARFDREAARANVDLSLSQRLPEPSLTVGYKNQSNGYTGAFLGASVPLPLFDRNAGRINASRSGLDASQTRTALLAKEIEYDVRRAYRTYESLDKRITSIKNDLLSGTEDLLRIARISYEEGEMSLIELLDAATAYRDARTSVIDLTADYWIAYFDLVRATGGGIESTGRR
ncbi:MAG: TolC family protein [Rhodothermales bacterium]